MSSAIPHEALARAVTLVFGDAARITRTEPLHGDASSRRYVRLTLAGARVPTTVAMLLGEGRFAPGSDELGGSPALTELALVTVGRGLARHDFRIPPIVAARSRKDGFLLLEDVGDQPLWAAVDAGPRPTRVLFADAVDMLAKLQIAGARDPDPACIAFGRRFDGVLARAELEHFVEHGIETRHGHALPLAERRALLHALAPCQAPSLQG